MLSDCLMCTKKIHKAKTLKVAKTKRGKPMLL